MEDPDGTIINKKSIVLSDASSSPPAADPTVEDSNGQQDDGHTIKEVRFMEPALDNDAPDCNGAAIERVAKLTHDLTVKDQVGMTTTTPQLPTERSTIPQDMGREPSTISPEISNPTANNTIYHSDTRGDVPMVGATHVEMSDIEQYQRYRRAERCCMIKSLAIALFVNTVLVGGLVSMGFCFYGSCSRTVGGQMENFEPISPPGLLLVTESPTGPSVSTPVPAPSRVFFLPVPVIGKVIRRPPTLDPTTSAPLPLEETESTVPQLVFEPPPLNPKLPRSPPICFDGVVSLTCRRRGEASNPSCDAIQPPFNRRCNAGSPLQQVEFSFHFLFCNPFGSSQQDESSCEDGKVEEPRFLNPVTVTCESFEDKGEEGSALLVSPEVIEPGQVFSVRAQSGLLPEKIHCTVFNASQQMQSVVVDTSGDVTLSLGDFFGGLRLESCETDTGETRSCLEELNFDLTVTNRGRSVLLSSVLFSIEESPLTSDEEAFAAMSLELIDDVRNPLPQSLSTTATLAGRVSVCTGSEGYTAHAYVDVEVPNYQDTTLCRGEETLRVSVTNARQSVTGFFPGFPGVDNTETIDDEYKGPGNQGGDGEGQQTPGDDEGAVSPPTTPPNENRVALLAIFIALAILSEFALAAGICVFFKRWQKQFRILLPKSRGLSKKELTRDLEMDDDCESTSEYT